jgi:sulfur-oxidizing protein SoxA
MRTRSHLPRSASLAIAGAVAVAGASWTFQASFADPNSNELVIEGQKIVTSVPAPEGSPFDTLYSGWRFRNEQTQQQQMDDFENPAFPLVDLGAELWNKPEGEAGKSCASCHNDASKSMKGVRASMPKYMEAAGKPQSLEHYINKCPYRRNEGRALEMGIEPDARNDGVCRSAISWNANCCQNGRQNTRNSTSAARRCIYTPVGQLDMSCAGCHENNTGRMIRADHLSQGHINGFPLYRSKWQKVGSIHRRFRGCMNNIRANPHKRGSDEFVALELYVASRGLGLSVETPAVRN